MIRGSREAVTSFGIIIYRTPAGSRKDRGEDGDIVPALRSSHLSATV